MVYSYLFSVFATLIGYKVGEIMATLTKFQEIEPWKLSRELVNNIYLICKSTDLRKNYSLKDQIQRASVSIMSNIAEGFERGNNKEIIYFLRIDRGSCAEVMSQLYIILDLEYIDKSTFYNIYEKAKSINKP